MPLLLAPYNSAMRLGSGFNSYTQQLCVNNAVVKENKEPATNADLRPLSSTEGNNGQTSQSVTWTANFVDKASDVLTSLNISGSLAIKFGLSGGARGEGAYLNTDKMKESDLNYIFQVRVVNQRLAAQDVTRFNSIPNAPKGNFTDIYGDCYISGFLEGGEFNALMSTKVHDKSQVLKASGAISAQFQAGPVKVDAEAKGAYENAELNRSTTSSISVSWVGGGNIRRGDAGKEWTLSSMMSSAITFPEQVALYPQYTHAVLTKYTALRSYQELSFKSTPLDYENAGVYTASLLDAYMEYKLIWSDITNMARDLQANIRHFTVRTEDKLELLEYATEAQNDFARKTRAYYGSEKIPDEIFKPKLLTISAGANQENTKEQQLIVANQVTLGEVEHKILVAKRKLAATLGGEHFEPPMKPNAMVPYAGTLISLDRARRDCRWEMIKIVKEVDEITKDPAIATDPERIWAYLNPLVFRQLLPAGKILPPYSQKWVDDALAEKLAEIAATNDKLMKSETELTVQKDKYTILQKNSEEKDQKIALLTKDSILLASKEEEIKSLQYLKSQLAVVNQANEGIKSLQKDITSLQKDSQSPAQIATRLDGLKATLDSFKGINLNDLQKQSALGLVYRGNGSAMYVKPGRDFRTAQPDGSSKKSLQILFDKTYSKPPKVALGITGIDSSGSESSFKFKTSAYSVTEEGFSLSMGTWDNGSLDMLSTTWFEFDENNTGIQSESIRMNMVNQDLEISEDLPIEFHRKFSKKPKVICWIEAMDISRRWPDKPTLEFDLHLQAQDVTMIGFTLNHLPHRLTCRAARYRWIAVDPDMKNMDSGCHYLCHPEFYADPTLTPDYLSGRVVFTKGTFTKPPRVFAACGAFSIREGSTDLKFVTNVFNITMDGFEVSCETWGGIKCRDMTIGWIAFL